MKPISALAVFAVAIAVEARSLTVKNNCPFTVWPAMFTAGPDRPNYATGWQANAHSQVSFSAPDNWKSGRIWGRRNCNFDDPNPATQCADGGCNGGLQCDPQAGTGIPPVTIAEFTLQGAYNLDNYDVSLVDGFNLPMRIDNDKGCGLPSCPVDLNPQCPAPLKGPTDSSGNVLGCKSACKANLDSDPNNSANCCTGSHDKQETCPSSGVQFYDYFKSNCPGSYAYAYDEPSGTALYTCDANKAADYTRDLFTVVSL